MRDLASPQKHDDARGSEEEGDEEDGEESAVRVAELSRRIASRCLNMEQECSRRERSQTRLFQEQLRGVRQVRVPVFVFALRHIWSAECFTFDRMPLGCFLVRVFCRLSMRPRNKLLYQ